MRILIAAIALGLLAYSLFGLAATFEPPGFIAWRIFWGATGAACLGAIVGAIACAGRSA